MKVLQINAVNGYSSTGRTVWELNQSLESRGITGYVAYSQSIVGCDGQYKIGNRYDQKMHAFMSRLFGKQGYFSKRTTKKLIKWIDDIQPDIIHLRNLHSNYINLEILLTYIAQKDIPTVLTLHDCWFYTGKCTHYTLDNCHKWKKNCGNCPRLKKDNKSWFFDRTPIMLNDKKKWFDSISRLAVVGVSKWISNEAKKSILSSSIEIETIYNWIDLDKFYPRFYSTMKKDLELNDKFIILGVASNWNNAKGLDLFIELANYISEDEVIVLVGKLPEQINLPDNIVNVSETHEVEVLAEIYSIADVFLNLSLEESFGKVSAESLACGTPVISNRYTANPELVAKNCGYILEEITIKEIIKKYKLIKKQKKCSFSSSCVKHAENNFDKNQRVEDYITLYKKMLAY